MNLHERDDSMVIAATNIKANPIAVAIIAAPSIRIRAKIQDIEKGSRSIPPTMLC